MDPKSEAEIVLRDAKRRAAKGAASTEEAAERAALPALARLARAASKLLGTTVAPTVEALLEISPRTLEAADALLEREQEIGDNMALSLGGGFEVRTVNKFASSTPHRAPFSPLLVKRVP
jgi:hypothetical protein